ncbi:hypothetical protein [Holospora curviuscula]|uniref:Uncharacterized protein n=1 Tax=Holospora curviuscula TaxID=1082868 RepID=A0A2S5R8X5_9PROT|nr:hypothetical protein [Holospora curviuscula]PPE03774.1 hypothetical protein HCUR_00789 [Holospora curviuscula]
MEDSTVVSQKQEVNLPFFYIFSAEILKSNFTYHLRYFDHSNLKIAFLTSIEYNKQKILNCNNQKKNLENNVEISLTLDANRYVWSAKK